MAVNVVIKNVQFKTYRTDELIINPHCPLIEFLSFIDDGLIIKTLWLRVSFFLYWCYRVLEVFWRTSLFWCEFGLVFSC